MSSKESVGIESPSDTWGRFERAVDAAVKSGPRHRSGKSKGEVKVGDDAHDKRGPGNRRGDDRGD